MLYNTSFVIVLKTYIILHRTQSHPWKNIVSKNFKEEF